jgi:hypothetical protein
LLPCTGRIRSKPAPSSRPGTRSAKKHPEADNNARQAAFKADLNALEWVSVPRIEQHPSNKWKGEPSLLVLGISRQQAMDLGDRLEQNAIVWCGPDAVPELVLLR